MFASGGAVFEGRFRGFMLLAAFLCVACESSGAAESAREKAAVLPRAPARPEFARGPTGGQPIAPFVAAEATRARKKAGTLLVYVGASWCEPCRRFHEAVDRGELDGVLGGLTLIEFDLDVDRDALEAAGCASRLIPLFAVPAAEGTCSDRRIEGSVKGPEAVQRDLVPRLRALLAAGKQG